MLSGMRSLTGVSARLRAGFGPPLASPVIMKAIVIIIIFKKERFPLPLGPPNPFKMQARCLQARVPVDTKPPCS